MAKAVAWTRSARPAALEAVTLTLPRCTRASVAAASPPPRPARRWIHSTLSRTQTRSPVRQVAQQLGLPCFQAHASQLELLASPVRFHDELVRLIASARRRIVLASLYIGPTEHELVHTHLRAALERNPNLQCTILLDALRSTREPAGAPSAASLVAALARDFPSQVDARLHLTPRITSAWLRRILPRRFGEGLGLQHIKLYLADDHFIISGANLSRDYFTNRQDRYLLLRGHAVLSDYVYDFVVNCLVPYAYRLEAAASTSSLSASSNDTKTQYAPYQLSWDGGEHAELVWSSSRHSNERPKEYAWASQLGHDLQSLTQRWSDSSQQAQAADGDVEIVPLLQLKPVGIVQETDALRTLFSKHMLPLSDQVYHDKPDVQVGQDGLPASATIDLTTGYFSPSPSLVELLLEAGREVPQGQTHVKDNAPIRLRVLTAAPRANGFYGSAFPSGLLPAAYVLLERAFAKRARRAGWVPSDSAGTSRAEEKTATRPARVLEMRRWEKPGWTYHAKGIWLTPPGRQHPEITTIGSSNYGRRSSDLDAECTFLIGISTSSSASSFGIKLGAERDALFDEARPWIWDRTQDFKDEERRLGIELGPLVRALTLALKRLL